MELVIRGMPNEFGAFDAVNLFNANEDNINFFRVKVTGAKFDGMKIDCILVTELMEAFT